MSEVRQLDAMEILDSRGRPTVRASITLASGVLAYASVPSGASTGKSEALELRDHDTNRFGGLGCLKAVENIRTTIASRLIGKDFATQLELDRALIELDGTANKSKLGANAILAVSIAFARAMSIEQNVPLFQHFATMIDNPSPKLPQLTINLFSGGKHAGGQVAIQDVLIVPHNRTVVGALADAYAVYQAAIDLTWKKYRARALTADEGGLAPPFASAESMLDDAVESIQMSGLKPGEDVSLAVDVASSQFYADGKYQLGKESLDADGMIQKLLDWSTRYPIVSIEDGLAEEAWNDWPGLRRRMGTKVRIMGDDLLCTNPKRIERAIETRSADALLLKVNQIGTLTEAAEALRLSRGANWHVTISARSGETEDDWLADLAVGWSANQIKIGSIKHSERLSKYNRLVAIERELS